MVEFVNLTPHPIVVVRGDCPSKIDQSRLTEFTLATIPPSGVVARVKTSREKVGEINGIPLYKTVFGEVEDLPEPEEGKVFIVSILVLQAVAGKRNDVVAPDTSPSGAVRDPQGRIIAVKGFQIL